MSLPHTADDALRIHDVAIVNWLTGLHVDYGDVAGVTRNDFPILSVFASPTRPFAAIPKLLVSRGWIAGGTPEEMTDNAETNFDVLPLPICTLQRLEPTPDPELAGVPKVLRKHFFNQQTGQWEQHQWPGHYRTEYTLTFWSLNVFTDNYIREWIYAEFGGIGGNQNERFIPVTHRAPWGVQHQALKFTSSSNLSDLEGDKYRFIRTEFTVSLRTWIMRPADAVDGYPVQSLSVLLCNIGAGYREDSAYMLSVRNLIGAPGLYSGNVFQIPYMPALIPTAWPKTGDAAVQQGTIGPAGSAAGTLRIEVTDTGDTVELVERVTTLDSMQLAFVAVSFAYVATAAASVEVAQRDSTTSVLTSSHVLMLPATPVWKRKQFFTLVNTPIFNVSVAGVGISSVVNIADVEIRAIVTQSMLYPTGIVDAGADIHYTWTGLPTVPVLVSARVTSSAGAVTVTLQDDAAVPVVTTTQEIDAVVNVGMVFLVQPITSSLLLIVPKTLALAWVSLQHYSGPYNGNDA